MKKNIFIVSLLIILFSMGSVKALSRNELEELDITRVIAYSLENGYRYVQGGTLTDKYIILLEINDEDDNTIMKVIDRKTFRTERVIGNYCFGHANDMTYNKKENKLVIVSGLGINKIYVLDADTFKLEKEVTTAKYYSSIGYDSITDQYVARHGRTIHILDSNFNSIDKFNIPKEHLTPQGLEVHNGKIYYVCYEAGGVTTYQDKYTGVLQKNENVIIVYDLMKKQKEKVYYVPQVTKDGIYPEELEGISFIGNIPILWANSNGSISIFKPVVTGDDVKIVLNSNIEISSTSNTELNLYKNNKLVAVAKNYNSQFYSFNIHYDYEATNKYELRLYGRNYRLNTNYLYVNVYYDFYNNGLVASYNDNIYLTKIN